MDPSYVNPVELFDSTATETSRFKGVEEVYLDQRTENTKNTIEISTIKSTSKKTVKKLSTSKSTVNYISSKNTKSTHQTSSRRTGPEEYYVDDYYDEYYDDHNDDYEFHNRQSVKNSQIYNSGKRNIREIRFNSRAEPDMTEIVTTNPAILSQIGHNRTKEVNAKGTASTIFVDIPPSPVLRDFIYSEKDSFMDNDNLIFNTKTHDKDRQMIISKKTKDDNHLLLRTKRSRDRTAESQLYKDEATGRTLQVAVLVRIN